MSVLTDKQNNIYTLGTWTGTIQIGTNQISSPSLMGRNGFLLKRSSKGALIWLITRQLPIGETWLHGAYFDANMNLRIYGGESQIHLLDHYFFLPRTSLKDIKPTIFTLANKKITKRRSFLDFKKGMMTKVTITQKGDKYIAGIFKDPSRKKKAYKSYGKMDIFLAKYTRQNHKKWLFTAGGRDNDTEADFVLDSAQNIRFFCTIKGRAHFNKSRIGKHGTTSSVIAHFSPGGAIQWYKHLRGSKTFMIKRIQVDSNDNTIIVGYIEGKATIDSKRIQSRQKKSIFVIKMDKKGKLLWARTSQTNDSALPTALKLDNTNNIYMAGHFKKKLAIQLHSVASRGMTDIFIAKWKPNGDLLWLKQVGGSLSDNVNDLSIDSRGDIILTGGFQKQATFGKVKLRTSFGYGLFTLKLNQKGQVLWAKQ